MLPHRYLHRLTLMQAHVELLIAVIDGNEKLTGQLHEKVFLRR